MKIIITLKMLNHKQLPLTFFTVIFTSMILEIYNTILLCFGVYQWSLTDLKMPVFHHTRTNLCVTDQLCQE